MVSEENALAGYAGLVGNTLFPLNENRKFKRQFKNKNLKILMNCPVWIYAALIVIEKGTIRVDGIKNKPIENISKNTLHWDLYLDMDIVLYAAILSNRKSLFDLARDWFRGEIKLKGIRRIPELIKLFNCLFKEKLEYNPLPE